MTEREIFEKFDKLSQDELNTKSNKNVYVRNNIMTTVIKCCTGEIKKRQKKNRWIQKKVDDSRIWNFRMPWIRSQIKNREQFINEKILKEYSVKIYKIDPYFYEHYGKKIQVDENRCKYILFWIDIYFTEYLLAVEVDEKGHTDETLFLRRHKKHYRKNLVVNLLELRVKKAIM